MSEIIWPSGPSVTGSASLAARAAIRRSCAGTAQCRASPGDTEDLGKQLPTSTKWEKPRADPMGDVSVGNGPNLWCAEIDSD
jgi:hypothetical protein